MSLSVWSSRGRLSTVANVSWTRSSASCRDPHSAHAARYSGSMYPDRRSGSSARGPSVRSRVLDDIGRLRVDNDRFDDVLGRESGEMRTAAHALNRGGLVHEQARFILRDEDHERKPD